MGLAATQALKDLRLQNATKKLVHRVNSYLETEYSNFSFVARIYNV